MNVPAVAKRTFEKLQNELEFIKIVNFILDSLKKISNFKERSKFIHAAVDEFNQEVFNHPLVKEFSPCKSGCTACCHTQVSVTQDEAELLAARITNGVKINSERLHMQSQVQNDQEAFYNLNFADRKCIFLNDEGLCSVYEDRPSVCRTNSVLGSPSQCDTSKTVQPVRLVLTPKADMAIYAAFLFSSENGALPYMVSKAIRKDQ
jgi:Fe-S-cluster containining protein